MTEFGFEHVELRRDKPLGHGPHSSTFIAHCDEIICAAKVFHMDSRQAEDPIASLKEAHQLLRSVRHPNIIQFLGMHTDVSGEAIILMELCDENLTTLLQQSLTSLPYYVEVNICHDVAKALAYLHRNHLIHGGLTSNNVVIVNKTTAKVGDYALSQSLNSFSPGMDRVRVGPDKAAYMPPEAFREPPVLTSKLDCFSWGVLAIQVMSRDIPTPEPRFERIRGSRYKSGYTRILVPEESRRQFHIDKIDSAHPLLQLARNCLSHEDMRPSASQLCMRIKHLKRGSRFTQSASGRHDSSADSLQQQVEKLVQENHSLRIAVEHKMVTMETIGTEMDHMRQELGQGKEMRQQLKTELEESQKCVAELQAENTRLHVDGGTIGLLVQPQSSFTSLRWEQKEKAPTIMTRGSAVAEGNTAYFNPCFSNVVYAYELPPGSSEGWWSCLPVCPFQRFSLAIIKGKLTTIGGIRANRRSACLLSLSQQQWTEQFPKMLTERCDTTAVVSGKMLVVVGGEGEQSRKLGTVEIMNTQAEQWQTVTWQPCVMSLASSTVCGGQLYLGGGFDKNVEEIHSVYTCSLAKLLTHSPRRSKSLSLGQRSENRIWRQIKELPMGGATLVTVRGQLLALGGRGKTSEVFTGVVHRYNLYEDSWEVIGHMKMARSFCLAAVLSDDRLVAVGGHSSDKRVSSVEMATVE